MAPRAPPRPPSTVPGSLLASFQLTAKLAPSGRHRVLGGARLAASARPRAGSGSAGRLAGAAALHRVPASSSPALSACPCSKAAPGGPRARPALPGHPAQTPARLTHPARGISLRSRPRPLAPALVSPARKLSTLLSPGRPDIPNPPPPPRAPGAAKPGQGVRELPAATVTDFLPGDQPRGRGGDVSAPPRPPPRAPDPGAPAGSASRTVAAVSGQAGPASLPQRCLAVPTAERPPFSTAPRLPRRRRAPAPERPRGAHLSRGLPRRPPPPAFPTPRTAGRKPEQPLQTGLDGLYFSCSPPTSGCDLF
ncbi:hypothetical protein R6Z07_019818 [Ovis aries]